MPKIHHVKKARKDYPEAGIAKGDSYYWWEFMKGPKVKSKIYPQPWQLTQSPFLKEFYQLQNNHEVFSCDWTMDDLDELSDALDDLKTKIDELIDWQQESLDNMPESLQESPTGQLLQERIDELESWNDGFHADVSDVESQEEIEEIIDTIKDNTPGF
jgi:hypothetical protein